MNGQHPDFRKSGLRVALPRTPTGWKMLNPQEVPLIPSSIYPLVMSTVCYWTWPSRNSGFSPAINGGSFHSYVSLPEGKHTKSYGTWPFIVDFPIKNGDFPSFFVGLPGRVFISTLELPPRFAVLVGSFQWCHQRWVLWWWERDGSFGGFFGGPKGSHVPYFLWLIYG